MIFGGQTNLAKELISILNWCGSQKPVHCLLKINSGLHVALRVGTCVSIPAAATAIWSSSLLLATFDVSKYFMQSVLMEEEAMEEEEAMSVEPPLSLWVSSSLLLHQASERSRRRAMERKRTKPVQLIGARVRAPSFGAGVQI